MSIALTMTSADRIAAAIAQSEPRPYPFRHWLLTEILPPDLCRHFAGWPQAHDAPVASGRRETVNPTRRFLDMAAMARDPCAADLGRAFESACTRSAIASLSGARLDGTHLRIEHAIDRDGFWLEPHTDIGAKRVTLLVFLSDAPGCTNWGTDLYDDAHRPVARADARVNSGLLFTPGKDTWHGFEKRPIRGTRRTLIVNYVDDTWKARHELLHGGIGEGVREQAPRRLHTAP